MLIKEGQRGALLDGFGRGLTNSEGLTRVRDIPKSDISGDDILFIWSDENADFSPLPELIVVADDKLRDTIAWAATFFGSFRPFSAFCRVIESSALPQLRAIRERPVLGRLSSAAAALIVAEGMGNVPRPDDPRLASPNLFTNTYSYVLARALALGYSTTFQETACQQLFEIRKSVGSRIDQTWSDGFKMAFSVISALNESGKRRGRGFNDLPLEIVQTCHDIFNGIEFPELLHRFSADRFGPESLRELMHLSRENRVRVVEDALTRITSESKTGNIVTEFLGGYLTSLIDPGSIAHVSLLLSPERRAMVCWYALCSGLHRDSQILDFAAGLGRRIVRKIQHPFLLVWRPSCDISASEFRVLRTSENAVSRFRLAVPGSIAIEVIPGVVINLTLESRDQDDKVPRDLAKRQEEERLRIGQELIRTSERLQSIGRSLLSRGPESDRYRR